MKDPLIEPVQDSYEECGEGNTVFGAPYERVCYGIYPKENYKIESGEKSIKIYNTVNQLSVFKAGSIRIKT